MLDVERRGDVLRLRLNRPERLNAVTATDLDRATAELSAVDPAVRVVVLTGTGRAFSSGADLSAQADGPSTLDAANRLVAAIVELDRPVVAAVNGPAAGVSCSIALAADIVVAAEGAYFVLPFTGIGLMPDGGASLLVPANVGRARAMHMALLPDRMSAAEAYAAGLIYRVVPDADFEAAVDEVVGRLAAGSRPALAAAKRAVNAATLGGLDAALAGERAGQVALLGSADVAEGVVAFAERRAPRFTD